VKIPYWLWPLGKEVHKQKIQAQWNKKTDELVIMEYVGAMEYAGRCVEIGVNSSDAMARVNVILDQIKRRGLEVPNLKEEASNQLTGCGFKSCMAHHMYR
jgi:hypothetical protein